jgi:hypothetical protein
VLSFKELEDLIELNEKHEVYEACIWIKDIIKAKKEHNI